LAYSTEGKITLRRIIFLSLPAIVGTAFFLVGVIGSKVTNIGEAPCIDFSGKSTFVERIAGGISSLLYLVLYLGAAFGPLLLPFAGYEAIGLTRAVGMRSRIAIWAWTFVVVGLVATALFWGWLSKLDIFV
jgi:hypothetical protein